MKIEILFRSIAGGPGDDGAYSDLVWRRGFRLAQGRHAYALAANAPSRFFLLEVGLYHLAIALVADCLAVGGAWLVRARGRPSKCRSPSVARSRMISRSTDARSSSRRRWRCSTSNRSPGRPHPGSLCLGGDRRGASSRGPDLRPAGPGLTIATMVWLTLWLS